MNNPEHKPVEKSFSAYVNARKREAIGGDGPTRYAYAADVHMLRTFRKIKPIELAASSIVRVAKDLRKNEMLGTMIRVGPNQFPSIYAIARECAERLQVPTPVLYVANNPYVNAYTFGTDDDAFIVVNSTLVDHFDEDELRFVIGHEVGHIQNKHVVYNTALILLERSIGGFFRWILPPAEIALRGWYRRAEITCDRAGLLCVHNPESAFRSFLKLACGSKKLYADLNVDAYLSQLNEGRQGAGRFYELFASHPYLPKRIEALRIFQESQLYKNAKNIAPVGLTMNEVDERVSKVINVIGVSR